MKVDRNQEVNEIVMDNKLLASADALSQWLKTSSVWDPG
jgi:hypothetical protein